MTSVGPDVVSSVGPDVVSSVRTVGTELDALVPEWDALARRAGSGFACRPTYGLSWFAELGSGSLEIVTARRDGALVAVAPLHRRMLAGRPVLRWLGHGLGTVGQLVAVDVAAAGAVWQQLSTLGTALQLTHLRLDDLGTLALRRSPAWQVCLQVDDRCPTLVLPPGTRAADVRGARSLKRLAKYRRALARAEQPFDVEVVTDLAGLHRRWPDIVRVAADADRESGRDNLCGAPYDGFTLTFLEQEARAGALLIIGGTVGGRWSAHEIGLRHGRRLELWLSRFDPQLSQVGMGHLVAERLVDLHDDLGVDVVDFGLGENDYKAAWADGAHDIATLTAAPGRLGPVLLRLAAARAAGVAVRRVRR